MFNPPNSLSLLRAPLALLFLSESMLLRTLAVFCAIISDSIDGYLARKYRYTSKLGAILDPLMDKFFVFFVLIIFITENKLALWQAFLVISRDFFLSLFALYLFLSKTWKAYKFRSVLWGKISTALQFICIFLLTINTPLLPFSYWVFVMLGFFVFLELLYTLRSSSV